MIEKTEKKPKEHYVDNQKFLEAIILYKESVKKAEEEGKPMPKLTNYLGECLLKIATKLANRKEFRSYSFIDEMIVDSIENSLMYFNNFDPTRIGPRSGIVTPFSYFTQIMYFAFQRRILKEEKQKYIKYKYFEKYLVLGTGDLAELEQFNPLQNKSMYDNMTAFITKYEDREAKRKLRREESKRLKEENVIIEQQRNAGNTANFAAYLS